MKTYVLLDAVRKFFVRVTFLKQDQEQIHKANSQKRRHKFSHKIQLVNSFLDISNNFFHEIIQPKFMKNKENCGATLSLVIKHFN